MTLIPRTLLGALVLLLLPAAEPGNYLQGAFSHGEKLDFSLTWLGIDGGNATMSIAPVADDVTKYRMTSLAQSNRSFARIFKVHDEIESVVSRETFSTLQYRKHLQEGKRVKEDDTSVDETRHVATRKRQDAVDFPVPSQVFDPLSLIFHIRALELSPGKTYHFELMSDGKVYPVTVSVLGREVVRTEAGRFKTVIVEPKMLGSGLFRDDQNRLVIWYSDDERHLPIRIRSDVKVGTITAELRTAAISDH
jgi:hypothetical protein